MRHLPEGIRGTAATVAAVLVVVGLAALAPTATGTREPVEPTTDNPSPGQPCDTDIASRYVAGGDAVPFGAKKDDNPDTDKFAADVRYPEKLLVDHLQPAPGPWCVFNTSKNPTNSDQYVHEGDPTQLARAHELRPQLITLQVGRQNNVIVDHVTRCFKMVKDHDFHLANPCALKVLNDAHAWEKLNDELAFILNQYRTQQDGNPDLIMAILGYFNPYPSATSVATKIPGFCAKLQDTIPTCTIRWLFLPPALVTLDLIVKKLNTTIENVVEEFEIASQGRYFFVNPYEKFKDHCMRMEVEIKTKVYHPKTTVHDHNSKQDFGCTDPWIQSDEKDGTKSPFLYLTPAVTGVLILATQTTKGMGIYPDEDGHDCLSDLIWEAENGSGLLKNRLGVPEAAEEPCT